MRPLLLSLALAFCGVAPVLGQTTLDWPLGEFRPYRLDSGEVANPATDPAPLYRAEVHVPDAAWIRLEFGEVQLPPGSTVRMTAALDGEVQELDAEGLAMWNHGSAYFNGDTVYVDLIAGPQTVGNRLVLEKLLVHVLEDGPRGPCAPDNCGICGADDRVQSNVLWTGRLMPVGCTGAVIDESSCVVSAGHCVSGGYANVLQFNVPNSSANCAPNNPPVADQFPVTGYQYQDGGVGNDWAVITMGTNNQGQRPYDRYGVYRPIATTLGSAGQAVAVWGCGVNNTYPTRSQTQQTSGGTINWRYSTYYTYDVDVTYGNSGSALIRNNAIIGIVTHCSFYCDNIATRVDRPGFVAAREQLCGGPGGYCPAKSNNANYEYISNVTFGTINNTSGPSQYTDYTGTHSTQLVRGQYYEFTLTIGNPYASDKGGLWIDWNQDKDFGGTFETITTAWSGTGPYYVIVHVPYYAPLGETRLRVRIQDGNFDPIVEPCGTTSYGEVEDYAVVVIDQPQYQLGDLNCDGAIDGFDIAPFVLALTDPDAYAAQYPHCDPMLADINQDGEVDGFDIQPFVELLTGG